MNRNEYINLLKSTEYDFLRTNEHLGNNIILLGLGGSHAYGTNTPTSDIDIRGITLERPENILGFTPFEQIVEDKTDTTIYGFSKIVNLLMQANPNIIEILGLDEDQYLYLAPVGRELLDNKRLFLSQRVFYTFGGYASAQLARLENAMCRDHYSTELQNKHIKRSIDNAIQEYNSRHTDNQIHNFAKIVDDQLLFDLNVKDLPSHLYEEFYSTTSNVLRTYRAEINHRNKKKDDLHLAKHECHLVRLLLMCIDMLETGQIITHRVKDHDLLMDIRNGKFMKDADKVDSAFYDLVNELERKRQQALLNTSLPKKADVKALEKFVMEVKKKAINGEYNNQVFEL